jgi:hypothetical protein
MPMRKISELQRWSSGLNQPAVFSGSCASSRYQAARSERGETIEAHHWFGDALDRTMAMLFKYLH